MYMNYYPTPIPGATPMAGGGPVRQAAGLVAAAGHGDDTELAHFTKDELAMLDQLKGGERDINQSTGLPQYGWLGSLLKGLVRAGATIAGGMIAGPAGAAAASGLSTKLTGGSWNDALKGAAISGIGSFAMQGIGGGGFDPTKPFGAAANGGVNAATKIGATTSGGMAGIPAVTSAPLGAGLGATDAATSALSGGAPAGMGANFLAAAKSAPGLASALGALSTPLDGPMKETPYQNQSGPQFSVRPMHRQPIPTYGDPYQYGMGSGQPFYDNINPGPDYVDRVPGGIDYLGFADGGPVGLAGPTSDALKQAAALGYMNAKRGGQIRGPGTGTSDDIPAMLSDGEHVIPAREVAALGNGSSDAGHERIYKMREGWLKQAGYKDSNPKKMPKKVRGIGNVKISPRAA